MWMVGRDVEKGLKNCVKVGSVIDDLLIALKSVIS